MRAAGIGLAVLMAACTRSPPDQVFVPAKSFEYSIEATTGLGLEPVVKVGEGLTLHAKRRSGPWAEVARTSLPTDGCWVAPPPLPEEAEMADNVRWIVEPEGQATFNLGLTADHTRIVRFAKPGRYTLGVITSMWCSPPKAGNTITVVVRE
jgi:hypothetical protein